MSKQIEALKLALDALMEATKIHASSCKCSVCRAVIVAQDALAEQPAQTATYTCGVCGVSMHMEQPAQPSKPWVGLTQEDMYEIGEFKNTHGYVPTGFKRLAAAIEIKLREKNA